MFGHLPERIVRVPGGPRSVDIADMDGDGWNDVFVALRNFDRMVIFKNNQGTLELASEVPTGVSPRDVAVADYNEDGQLDAAVINRHSQDVSILPSHHGSAAFTKLDQIYETDGEVSGLNIIDFNRDGRDDVVQLHRASGDISVRVSDKRGRLLEPIYYSMGTDPRSAKMFDMNGDGREDIITANMASGGAIIVRLRTDDGYSKPEIFRLPNNASGGLFALEPGDYDGDGDIDVAAGYFDCRVALYRNDGTGKFEYMWNTFLGYESRVMTSGDFDQDGDLDLAGGGYGGDIQIFENPGDLLTNSKPKKTSLRPRSDRWFGSREIRSTDVNGDGDLDFVFGTGDGVVIYLGEEGMNFSEKPIVLESTRFPTSGLSMTDFDGDGVSDMAVSCQLLSCVTIMKGNRDGTFEPTLVVDVPAGDHLAAGDLDGDGLADIVGVGDVLWTALSGRRSENIASEPENITRPLVEGVVINEILAINESVPLEFDGGKRADFVELYNASNDPSVMDGWSLVLEGGEGESAYSYKFELPGNTVVPAKGRVMVVFSPDRRTEFHTGFRLPGDGATLRLETGAGIPVDAVTYPRQQRNVAYGRYQDGAVSFVFNPIPSPLAPNSFDGSPEPLVSFKGFDFKNLRPGEPVQVRVKGQDDLGIIGVSMVYQRLDQPGTAPGVVQLYDDGNHGDGEMLDGLFGGALESGLPGDGEMQFYFVVEDLSGSRIEIPDETVFVEPGQPVRTYSFGFAQNTAPLEIVSVSADNVTGLRDESGVSEDFLEVRNRSGQAVSLAGVMLAKDFDASDRETYHFPAGAILEPGETFVVYADGDVREGTRHAPFRIDRGGDTLLLMGTAPRGARTVIDFLETSRVESDALLTRIPGTDVWAQTMPGESAPTNFTEPWQGEAFDSDGKLVTALAFETDAGVEYLVEFGSEEDGWLEVARLVGDGELDTLTQEAGSGEFRITELKPPAEVPEFRSVVATPGKTTASIAGRLATDGGDSVELQVYWGAEDAGPAEDGWAGSASALVSEDLGFVAGLSDLNPGFAYAFRVRASNSAGAAWTSPVSFETLHADAPVLDEIGVVDRTEEGFTVIGNFSDAESVTVFYGSIDGREVPGAWQHESEVELGEAAFSATIGGLEMATSYVLRVRASNAGQTAWSELVEVSTLNEVETLRRNLLISEIMYHPEGAERPFVDNDLEFIEFYNAGTTTLDLSQLSLVSGVAFDFENAWVQSIDPGQFLVIVANGQAFESRYGNLDAAVAGEWLTPFRQTKLSNGGESIVLQHRESGEVIHAFTYSDGHPWPHEADGSGASLTLRSDAPGQDHADPEIWTASVSPQGTPGIAPVREPIILSPPKGAVLEEAGSFLLNATVVGIPPLSVQWFKDGRPVEEGTVSMGISDANAWIAFNPLKESDSGSYTLVTANEFGEVTTEPAVLVVNPRATTPGSLDLAFYPAAPEVALDVIQLPGGDLLTLGNPTIRRFKPSGLLDKSFTRPIVDRRGSVTAGALLPNGMIMMVGSFDRVSQLRRPGIARIHPDGTVDRSFDPKFSLLDGWFADVVAQPDGSVIVGGSYVARHGPIVRRNVMRILPSGAIDPHYMNDLKSLVRMTDSWRYRDNGDTFGDEWRSIGFDDSKWSEGPALLYVEQAELNGPANTEINLTRGSVTYYFRRKIVSPFDNPVEADLILSLFADDGAVVHLNGDEIFRLRLPEGMIGPDTVASPKVINAVEEGPFLVPKVALLPGENIIAVEVHQEDPGSSDIVFGLSLDTPSVAGASTSLEVGASGAVTVLDHALDGKVMVGGSFFTLSGTVRHGLARLLPNGTVDESFNPAVPFQRVNSLAVQPDGKVIVLGIPAAGGELLMRFLPNGEADPSFVPATNRVFSSMALAEDGSLYLGSLRAGEGPIRLLPDGTEDASFDSDVVNGSVQLVEVLGNDRLFVSGGFSEIDRVEIRGMARYFIGSSTPGFILEYSDDLVQWKADDDAIVDAIAGGAHTTLPLVESGQRYYRLKGGRASLGEPNFGRDTVYFRIEQ